MRGWLTDWLTYISFKLHPLNQQRPIVKWCDKHNVKLGAYCPLIRGNFNIPALQELAQKVYKRRKRH